MENKIVIAYSGGLDTSYCAHLMASNPENEVYAVTVNTGGFSTTEIESIKEKALAFGVSSYECVDARERLYNEVLRYLIYGNVLRNNTYPLSVSAERATQAMVLIEYAKKIGAKAIGHGSTGAGNDQVRFDLIFSVLAPEIEIITPIRDQTLSREEEIEYLKSHGYEFSFEKSKYSVNKGIWGTSVGGAETLTSSKGLPESAYPTQLSKTTPESLTLRFEKGELAGVNDTKGTPAELITYLEQIAAPFAIGRDIHVGDTILGIKGRVGFEAAAALIILKAHELLEKHVLTKWQQFQKQQLAQFYGMLLHEGQLLDPVMRDAEAYLTSSQDRVTGEVYLTLHPYRFTLEGIDSVYDMMKSKVATYGETNKAWDSRDAKGFIKIYGNAIQIAHHAGKN
ncbi:MAG: argininosuccinate synthase [Bacteroidetes bacterium]|nr:argininosuccinate synthase [Bacteroidota bacterium]